MDCPVKVTIEDSANSQYAPLTNRNPSGLYSQMKHPPVTRPETAAQALAALEDEIAVRRPGGPTIAQAIHARKYRVDGWSPTKVAGFLQALADTGSVTHAAEYVRMSPSAAYQLRRHPDGGAFAEAWETAIASRFEMLTEIALDRVRDGVERVRWHGGEQVGVDRIYSDRLLLAMLDRADPARRQAAAAITARHADAAMLAIASGAPHAAAAAEPGPGLIGWSDEDDTPPEDDAEVTAFIAAKHAEVAAARIAWDAGIADIDARRNAARSAAPVRAEKHPPRREAGEVVQIGDDALDSLACTSPPPPSSSPPSPTASMAPSCVSSPQPTGSTPAMSAAGARAVSVPSSSPATSSRSNSARGSKRSLRRRRSSSSPAAPASPSTG